MTHHLRLKLEMRYFLNRGCPHESWFKVMREESPGAIQLVTPVENAAELRRWTERQGLGCYFFGEWRTDANYDLMVGVTPLYYTKTQMSS